jgi:putative DNA primase/helicase
VDAFSLWPAYDKDALDKAEQYNRQGYGVYVGVALRRARQRGDANCIETLVAWCDVDGKDFDREDIENGKRLALEAIQRRLPPHLQPHIDVDSGGGYHCYWFLEEPCRLTTPEDRQEFTSRLKGIARHLGGDIEATNPERVMRLPGFLHTKDAANHRPARILRLDEERPPVTLEDFEELAPPVVEKKERPAPAVEGRIPDGCAPVILSLIT